MTELERTGGKNVTEEATFLPSGHLAPVRLQGRPTPTGATGWSPTAWTKPARKDDQ